MLCASREPVQQRQRMLRGARPAFPHAGFASPTPAPLQTMLVLTLLLMTLCFLLVAGLTAALKAGNDGCACAVA